MKSHWKLLHSEAVHLIYVLKRPHWLLGGKWIISRRELNIIMLHYEHSSLG